MAKSRQVNWGLVMKIKVNEHKAELCFYDLAYLFMREYRKVDKSVLETIFYLCSNLCGDDDYKVALVNEMGKDLKCLNR